MRWIKKNAPPASFQEYVKEFNASYDDMDKRDLKDSLLVTIQYLAN